MDAGKDPIVVFTRWIEVPDPQTGTIYRANLTVRDIGTTEEELVAVIEETIRFWCRAASLYSKGVFVETETRWNERTVAFDNSTYHARNAVTVWGDIYTPDGRKGSITMTEDGTVGGALFLAKAALDAESNILALVQKHLTPEAKAKLESKPDPKPQSQNGGGRTPPASDGDVKIMTITKIAHSFSKEGVLMWEFYGLLDNGREGQHPLVRVYEDNEVQYPIIQPMLPQVAPGGSMTGKWKLTCTLAVKGEKTYKNPVRLEKAG